MSKLNYKRALSPLALTLLVAATGCTLDQTHEPTESIDEGISNGYFAAGTDGTSVVANDYVVLRDAERGLSLRESKEGAVPPVPQPEGSKNNGEEEEKEEEKEETNPPAKDDEGSIGGEEEEETLINIGQLKESQIAGVANAIVFATPAHMSPSLNDASFVDFDFAGAVTTAKQGLGGCVSHRVSTEANKMAIQFDCQTQASDGPVGDMLCSTDFTTKGAVSFQCDVTLQSAAGSLKGSVTAEYELAADIVVIDVETRAGDLGVDGHYVIDQVETTTHGTPCQSQNGQLSVRRGDRVHAASLKNVLRCANSCRPQAGTITYDLYNINEDTSTRIIVAGSTTADWTWASSNSSSESPSLSLCE